MTDYFNDEGLIPQLNLPPAELKFSRGDGVLKIFDILRKKYITATSEEYVRQRFVHWLTNHLHYPKSLMANEIGIELNGKRKRCDTVVFDTHGKPFMIVEYKSPEVAVTQKVFDQIVRYNMVLQARYLVVSNGMNHYCCIIDYSHATYNFIPTVPDYLQVTRPFTEN